MTVLATTCSLLPTLAYGQVGKRPDPDSPAGVEYQLPLDQARKNAAAGGGDQPGRGGGARRDAAPLFGAGIVARKNGDDSDAAGQQLERRSGDSPRALDAAGAGRAGGGKGDGSSPAGSVVDPSAAAVRSAPDQGSATLRIAGIALAVVLAGGLVGLGLRRALRQPGA